MAPSWTSRSPATTSSDEVFEMREWGGVRFDFCTAAERLQKACRFSRSRSFVQVLPHCDSSSRRTTGARGQYAGHDAGTAAHACCPPRAVPSPASQLSCQLEGKRGGDNKWTLDEDAEILLQLKIRYCRGQPLSPFACAVNLYTPIHGSQARMHSNGRGTK